MTRLSLPSAGATRAFPVSGAQPFLLPNDCLRRRDGISRVGGFFFYARQDRRGPCGKRLGGPVGSFAIPVSSVGEASSLSAINHGVKSQCVPNSEQIIINRRVQ